MLDEQNNDSANAPQLSATELRVLGVLMEKQLTTPDQYPLTLNSIVTACNQKSSRDPITQYQQGEVERALLELDNKNYIRRERGSRADRFEQTFMNQLSLGRKQQALLCVIMLRGPNTISELSTRTQRMCNFVDREELELCVERLCERDTPYTIRLAQQPGQRGERIMHLFSGTPDGIASSSLSAGAPTNVSASTSDSSLASAGSTTTQIQTSNAPQATDVATTELGATRPSESEQLEELVLELRTELDDLQRESQSLRTQLNRLYQLTGQSIDN